MKTLRRGIAVGVLEGPMYAVGEYKSQSCIRERRGEKEKEERKRGRLCICILKLVANTKLVCTCFTAAL